MRGVYTTQAEPPKQSAGLPALHFTSSLPKDRCHFSQDLGSAPFLKIIPMQERHSPLQSRGYNQVCRVGGVHVEQFRGWNPQNHFSDHMQQGFHHVTITRDLKLSEVFKRSFLKWKYLRRGKYHRLIILRSGHWTTWRVVFVFVFFFFFFPTY